MLSTPRPDGRQPVGDPRDTSFVPQIAQQARLSMITYLDRHLDRLSFDSNS